MERAIAEESGASADYGVGMDGQRMRCDVFADESDTVIRV